MVLLVLGSQVFKNREQKFSYKKSVECFYVGQQKLVADNLVGFTDKFTSQLLYY